MDLIKFLDQQFVSLEKYGKVEVDIPTLGRCLVTLQYLEDTSIAKGCQIVSDFIINTKNYGVDVYHMATNSKSVTWFFNYPVEMTDDKVAA